MRHAKFHTILVFCFPNTQFYGQSLNFFLRLNLRHFFTNIRLDSFALDIVSFVVKSGNQLSMFVEVEKRWKRKELQSLAGCGVNHSRIFF